MTSKISWATAAILIVAAVAVGTWAVWGGTPAGTTPPPPPPPSGEWVAVQTGTAYGIPAGLSSGVAKVHFMRHASVGEANYASTDNLSASTRRIGSLTASGQTISTFPYDNRYDIVVETQVHDDNMGQLTTAYMKVSINLKYDSGWDPSGENSTDNMENIFNSQSAYKGINVVWDNGGNGYVLRADDNLSVEDVTLWCRA